MDYKGQLPLEYLLILGFSIILLMPIAQYSMEENELNQAMAAARTGAVEGSVIDAFAVYPDESFSNYNQEHQRLLNPSSVKIQKIEYTNQGFNDNYHKTKIQLRIHASDQSIISKDDRNSLGDRINFFTRKKICQVFRTENLTNTVYNPAFSSNYMFTTADVCWE